MLLPAKIQHSSIVVIRSRLRHDHIQRSEVHHKNGVEGRTQPQGVNECASNNAHLKLDVKIFYFQC